MRSFTKYLITGFVILLSAHAFAQDIKTETSNDSDWNKISQITDDKANDSLKQQLILSLIYNYEFSRANNLLNKYENSHNTNKTPGFIPYAKSVIYNRQGQYDSALFYLSNSKELYLKQKDMSAVGVVFYEIAKNYSYQNKNILATDFLLKALDITQSLKDTANTYFFKFELGQYYMMQNKFSLAKSTYFDCLKYFASKDSNSTTIAAIYNVLSKVYTDVQNFDSAIYFIDKSSKIYKSLNSERGVSINIYRLADIAMKEKNYEVALGYYKQSYDYCEKLQEKRQIPFILQNIADCYIHLNNYEEASKIIEQALKQAIEQKDIETISLVYKHKASLEIKKGDFKNALEHNERYHHINDSLNSVESKSQQDELLIKYESELKDGKIQILNLEKENEKQSKYVFISIFLGILLITAFLIAYLILRHRTNKQLYNEQIKLNEANKIIADNEIASLKQTLEFNRKELNDYTQHLVERNNLIEELENKLNEIQFAEEKLSLERDKQVAELWRLKILTDEDWEKFKSHIENVYPGLTSKIKHTYGDITIAELRLFLMQKLKMETREIASLLGISASSVTKTKYRLKKKINLKEEDSLDEFISMF